MKGARAQPLQNSLQKQHVDGQVAVYSRQVRAKKHVERKQDL